MENKFLRVHDASDSRWLIVTFCSSHTELEDQARQHIVYRAFATAEEQGHKEDIAAVISVTRSFCFEERSEDRRETGFALAPHLATVPEHLKRCKCFLVLQDHPPIDISIEKI